MAEVWRCFKIIGSDELLCLNTLMNFVKHDQSVFIFLYVLLYQYIGHWYRPFIHGDNAGKRLQLPLVWSFMHEFTKQRGWATANPPIIALNARLWPRVAAVSPGSTASHSQWRFRHYWLFVRGIHQSPVHGQCLSWLRKKQPNKHNGPIPEDVPSKLR